MEDNTKKISQLKATISNNICMMLYMMVALFALSVGLYFYYVVPGRTGMDVGIAMFVIAALEFAVGELMYFMNMGKIKMNS